MGYAITDAQGRHGDYAKVYRTFATLAAADAYARRGGLAVLECEADAGDLIHREEAARYEQRADATRAGR